MQGIWNGRQKEKEVENEGKRMEEGIWKRIKEMRRLKRREGVYRRKEESKRR